MNLKSIFGKWDELPEVPFLFSGIWRNELHSDMTLLVDEKGLVSGTYALTSENGTRQTFLVTGFANGPLIGFTVDFSHGNIICSWTGHAVKESGGDVIKAQWNLVKTLEGEDFAIETWGATHCGSNTFKRVG